MVDPLHVIETVMRYFFGLAQSSHKANAPLNEVRKCFREAAQLAALAAPYRHARLSAVKHIDHQGGDTIDGIRPDASPEELRAEIAKRVALLRDRGYIDLDALPPPEPAPDWDKREHCCPLFQFCWPLCPGLMVRISASPG
jgi:hypothetical protein